MMKYCQPVESKKIYDVLENTRRLLFTLYIPLYSPKICIQESRDESVSNALNVLFGLWMSMFARWRENRVKCLLRGHDRSLHLLHMKPLQRKARPAFGFYHHVNLKALF